MRTYSQFFNNTKGVHSNLFNMQQEIAKINYMLNATDFDELYEKQMFLIEHNLHRLNLNKMDAALKEMLIDKQRDYITQLEEFSTIQSVFIRNNARLLLHSND